MTQTVRITIACSVMLLAMVGNADAAPVFIQDFESGFMSNAFGSDGLDNVQSSGFGRTNVATLGNSTFGVGHTSGYASGDTNDIPQDIYTLILDLSSVTNTMLSFEYSFDTNVDLDEWGLVVNSIALDPISGPSNNDVFDLGSPWSGPATSGSQLAATRTYNLSAFDGSNSVTVQIGLTPEDDFQFNNGYFIDNIAVTGDINMGGSTVPEPGSLALLAIGMAGLAGAKCRRRTLPTV